MNSSLALKSLRGKKLYTQQYMADKLNITRQTYNNYELNPIKIDLNIIIEIMDALEATNDEKEEFFNALKQDFMSYKM